MPDVLVRAINRPIGIRIVAAVTTELSRDAARRHDTTPAVGCALSRGLTATVLLGTLSTGGERITMQLIGDGPLRGLTVDAYGDGDVRGYPMAPRAWEGRALQGRQMLADLVGRDGVLNFMRDLGLKERYQGQVCLVRGEIDEDVEAYLRQSEQIPSALGAEAVLGDDGTIAVAGGLLAQVMPGGHTETLWQLQHGLRGGALYEALARMGDAATPRALCEALLPGLEIEYLDQRELRFRCRCSLERIEGMLTTLSPTDLDEMIVEGRAEITCNYCAKVYEIPRADLARIREQFHPARTIEKMLA